MPEHVNCAGAWAELAVVADVKSKFDTSVLDSWFEPAVRALARSGDVIAAGAVEPSDGGETDAPEVDWVTGGELELRVGPVSGPAVAVGKPGLSTRVTGVLCSFETTTGLVSATGGAATVGTGVAGGKTVGTGTGLDTIVAGGTGVASSARTGDVAHSQSVVATQRERRTLANMCPLRPKLTKRV